MTICSFLCQAYWTLSLTLYFCFCWFGSNCTYFYSQSKPSLYGSFSDTQLFLMSTFKRLNSSCPWAPTIKVPHLNNGNSIFLRGSLWTLKITYTNVLYKIGQKHKCWLSAVLDTWQLSTPHDAQWSPEFIINWMQVTWAGELGDD